MLKRCRLCGMEKRVDEFYKTSGNRCKPCHNAASVRRMQANPERTKATKDRWNSIPENKAKATAARNQWNADHPRERKAMDRRSKLKTTYGLTETEFNQMAARQDYCCKLCGYDEDQPLYVDHIKGTKVVRGLLCNSCNRGIGLLKHDPAVLAAAVDYVSALGL